jgi:hypothetical protein
MRHTNPTWLSHVEAHVLPKITPLFLAVYGQWVIKSNLRHPVFHINSLEFVWLTELDDGTRFTTVATDGAKAIINRRTKTCEQVG